MTVRHIHWDYKIWPDPSGWRYEVKVRSRPWRPRGPCVFTRGVHDGPYDEAETYVLDRAQDLIERFARRLP